jgi:hypothetical protein
MLWPVPRVSLFVNASRRLLCPRETIMGLSVKSLAFSIFMARGNLVLFTIGPWEGAAVAFRPIPQRHYKPLKVPYIERFVHMT